METPVSGLFAAGSVTGVENARVAKTRRTSRLKRGRLFVFPMQCIVQNDLILQRNLL